MSSHRVQPELRVMISRAMDGLRQERSGGHGWWKPGDPQPLTGETGEPELITSQSAEDQRAHEEDADD